MSQLAIVILNWNGRKYLEQFLPILVKNIPSYSEVIIADNGSNDDSVSFLEASYPELRILKFDKNLGFTEGYNQALNQVDSPYYCLLNSDIEVTPNWVEPIMLLFEQDSQIAAIQPKLLSYYKRNTFEYAGASGGFIDKYGYPFCRGRFFEVLETDNGQYDDVIDVFWATGAALFIRRDVFHQLGGLDNDFFAHMEEIDLCWRIKNAGYRVVINPKSVVYHIGGGTLPKNNSLKTYLNFRNNHYLLLKNLPSNRLFVTLIVRFFLDIVAAVVFLLQGNSKDFVAVFKAHFSFLKNYSKIKKKRTSIAQNAYLQTYPHSIVFAHYAKGKKFFDGHNLLK